MRPSLSRTLRAALLVGGSLAGLAAPLTERSAHAWDLEDYARNYRETRNAYLSYMNQMRLAFAGYELKSGGARALGFSLEQQEQYFRPLGVVDPAIIEDRTGDPCLDPAGNPNNALCNVDSTCQGDGTCGPRSGAFANADVANLAATYPRLLEIMDRVARTDGSTTAGAPYGTAAGLGDFIAYANLERTRAITLWANKVKAAEADLLPRPAGDPYEGLIVPDHLDTAEWELDPVLDQALIQNVAYMVRAGRDALLQAIWQYKVAEVHYLAARDAYSTAADRYTYSTSCQIDDGWKLPAAKWYCGARPNGDLHCACSGGPGKCASTDASVVNEPPPASSYRACPVAPEADQPCICVRNDPGANVIGDPCDPTAPAARTYD